MDDAERRRKMARVAELARLIRELQDEQAALAEELLADAAAQSDNVYPIRPANGKPEDGDGDSE